MSVSFVAKGTEDWHVAPSKLFTINTAGDIQGEMGDGTKIPIGKGDLVYLEDLTGKGLSRGCSPTSPTSSCR